MCLVLLAVDVHPRWSVLLAANRDERRDRPSLPLGPWDDAPRVIGGRDLTAGGSWFGVRTDGRFAAVTNVRRAPFRTAPLSRGLFVPRALVDDVSLADVAAEVAASGDTHGGMHLITGDTTGVWHAANDPTSPPPERLPPGVVGISNGPARSTWPKEIRGAHALADAIAADRVDDDTLFTLLRDTTPAPDDQLPDTGVGPLVERLLSPMFLVGAGYGTRSSTVLRLGRDGTVEVSERRWDEEGRETGRSAHRVTP